MKAILSYLLARAQEPSTWAGVPGIITGVTEIVAGNYALGVPAVLAGLAAMIVPENTSTTTTT